MKPYLDYEGLRLYHADALSALAEIADASVDMCVTSPPFWGLRDYGTGRWEGGDENCDHARPPRGGPSKTDGNFKSSADESRRVFLYAGECGKCGATRVDDQIGLEENPDAWADALAAVFDEVRRVLRPTGAMLVECGDSYNTSPSNGGKGSSGLTNPERQQKVSGAAGAHRPNRRRTIGDIKPKDLIGQPYLLAMALRASGWVWRGAYVWARPNPMPESVNDRCTTSHTTILHFSKARWIGAEPGRFADLAESDKRWLAAMIDTEGSIMVRRSRREDADNFAAQVSFVNTNEGLLAAYRDLLGGAGSIALKPHTSTNRPCSSIVVSNKIARDLLLAVYPYLIAKHEQARVAIYAQGQVYHRGGVPGVQGAGRRRSDAETALLERCWSTTKALNQGEKLDLGWCPEPTYGKWVAQPYYWDPVAVAEPVSENTHGRGRGRSPKSEREARTDGRHEGFSVATKDAVATRNARSVWTIPTEPSGMGLCPVCHAFWPRNAPDEHCGVEVVSHYAAFPVELAEKAIRAASSERGVCPCGAPWRRIVEKGDPELAANTWSAEGGSQYDRDSNGHVARTTLKHVRASETLGWEPTCGCGLAPVPALVLDPFGGSGTTLVAARRLNRCAVAVELNPHYCEMTGRRLEIPEVIERAAATSAEHTQLVLS